LGVSTTLYHALFSTYDFGGETGLRAATKAGKGFGSFNTEQQGDILREYYKRLLSGADVSAFQPFVNEVRSQPPTN